MEAESCEAFMLSVEAMPHSGCKHKCAARSDGGDSDALSWLAIQAAFLRVDAEGIAFWRMRLHIGRIGFALRAGRR